MMAVVFIYVICFLLSWVLLDHLCLSQLWRRYRRLPPGPTPLPIIGNLLSLGYKPHISLAHLAKTHGPVMCLKLGSLTTVVISSSSSAKEVMQKHDASLGTLRWVPDALRACNHSEMSMAFLPLNGIAKTLKKIATSEILTSSRLDSRSDLRQEKVNDLLSHVAASCQAGVPVIISERVFVVALDLMSSLFFSVDLSSRRPLNLEGGGSTNSCGESQGDDDVDVRELQKMMWQLAAETGKPNLCDFFPYLKMFDPQGRRRAVEAIFSRLLGLFDRLIDKRMKTGVSRSSGSGVDDGDTLDALLKKSRENINGGFDRQYIRHMLLDFFIGGTDTTTNTVEWAMSELLRNPTTMKKAQKELEEVIGKDNHIREADITKLPYMQAVFKETLRLHPAAPLLGPRRASCDVNLSNGFIVPKGAQVLINVWAIQKDTESWNDACAFTPERFLVGSDSDIDIKGFNFDLIPFGSGRRACPGMPLAIRFIQLILTSLIHSFDWKLEDGVTPENLDMEEEFGMTLHKAQPLRAIPVCKS